MSKRSSFQAPRFLDSFGAVQRALAEIQDSLDAATRSGYQMGVRTSAVALTSGGFFRVSAPTAGVTATLPAAGASNAAELITLCLEAMLGALTVHAPPGQTVNGAVTATFSGEGIVTLFSNGVDAWFSTSELPSESPGGAALDATYFLQTAHASLPNGRVGAATAYFGLTIGPDYDTAGFVSWEPGAQAAGSWWAQLLELDTEPPRAYLIADSLGEGLEYLVDVTNASAPAIRTISESNASGASLATHVIPMPPLRLPGDRIVIGLEFGAPSSGTSPIDMTSIPAWARLGGEATGVSGGTICFDMIELIIAADGSNDPGASISFNLLLGAPTTMGAHVWLLRDAHPTLAGESRMRTSAASGPTVDVGLCLAPWGGANNFWGTFCATNNATPGMITDFPDDFTTGQGQFSGNGMTFGYGSRLLRADRLDATSWSFAASPRFGAFTFAIPPKAAGQIQLSASSSIPAETVLGNFFNTAQPARAWLLSDLAGTGLSTATAVANGPFPEIDDANSLVFAFDVTAEPHLVPVPPLSVGQGVLMAVASGSTGSIVTPAERPWQLLGNGLGTSNRLTLYWLAPADVTQAVVDLTTRVTIDLSAPQACIVQYIVVDDHHRTVPPTISAFALQNSTGGTSVDVAGFSPIPGDGSLEANYTYALIFASATEDSIIGAGYPAGYTDGVQTFVSSTTGTIDNSIAWCRRQIRGASEDAAAITYAGSGNGRSIAVNVAFCPDSVAVMNWDGLGVQQASVAQGLFPTLDFASTASVLATGGAFADRWQVRYQRAALTGDVTAAQDVNVTVIANDAVNNAKLANMAAGTQKGRQIDAGTGDPVDLTGEEQGENIRYGNTQEFLSVAAGDYTSASFGTTLAAIDPTVSTLHFSAAGAGDINFHGFPEKNGKRYVIKKRSALGRLVFKHDSGTEGTAGARIEGPGNFDFHINSVNGSVIIEDQFGRWRPCNLDRPAPSTTQNVGTGGSVALNDDTTQVLVTASITITSFTGADLENRRIILRVAPGEVCTLDHLAVDIRCPRNVDLLVQDNESVWLYHTLGEWMVATLAPQTPLLRDDFLGDISTVVLGILNPPWRTAKTAAGYCITEEDAITMSAAFSANHPGQIELISETTIPAGNYANYQTGFDFGTVERVRCVIQIPTGITRADAVFGFGLVDDPTIFYAVDTAGVWDGGNSITAIVRDNGTGADNWILRRETAGASAELDSGDTATVATWFDVELVNEGGGVWRLLLNGVSQGTVTGAPTSGRCAVAFGYVKLAGVAQKRLTLDLVEVFGVPTIDRRAA